MQSAVTVISVVSAGSHRVRVVSAGSHRVSVVSTDSHRVSVVAAAHVLYVYIEGYAVDAHSCDMLYVLHYRFP
jgi:hypothetical protein